MRRPNQWHTKRTLADIPEPVTLPESPLKSRCLGISTPSGAAGPPPQEITRLDELEAPPVVPVPLRRWGSFFQDLCPGRGQNLISGAIYSRLPSAMCNNTKQSGGFQMIFSGGGWKPNAMRIQRLAKLIFNQVPRSQRSPETGQHSWWGEQC